jgi:GNAT superfamily N-acetyltransferase
VNQPLTSKQKVNEPNYVLRQIQPTDRVNKLKLRSADASLSAFLQRSCQSYHAGHIARTYVFVDGNEPEPRRVVAYISILVSEVARTDAAPPDIPDYRYPACPSIKIARLAVDLKLQRAGLGRKLVAFCLALAKSDIMQKVGCRFVMVDANKSAVDFYKRCGFILVDTDENRQRDEPIMFYDLKKVEVPQVTA